MSDQAWVGTWLIAAIVSYVAAIIGSNIGLHLPGGVDPASPLARFHHGNARAAYIVAVIAAIGGVGVTVALAAQFVGHKLNAVRAFFLSIGSAMLAYVIWGFVTIMLANGFRGIGLVSYAAMAGAAVLVARRDSHQPLAVDLEPLRCAMYTREFRWVATFLATCLGLVAFGFAGGYIGGSIGKARAGGEWFGGFTEALVGLVLGGIGGAIAGGMLTWRLLSAPARSGSAQSS